LFRTLTALLSPALSLPKGGPTPGSIPPLAGGVNLPRGEWMGRARCLLGVVAYADCGCTPKVIFTH